MKNKSLLGKVDGEFFRSQNGNYEHLVSDGGVLYLWQQCKCLSVRESSLELNGVAPNSL